MDKIRFILSFALGFITCLTIFSGFYGWNLETPLTLGYQETSPNSPGDWLSSSDIKLTKDSIIINIQGASISKYASTGSMAPVFDTGANGIRIKPQSPEDISIGDIVTFGEENIVHRVVELGVDDFGYWYITKGDNNNYTDEKIRFEEIRYVTIGILY